MRRPLPPCTLSPEAVCPVRFHVSKFLKGPWAAGWVGGSLAAAFSEQLGSSEAAAALDPRLGAHWSSVHDMNCVLFPLHILLHVHGPQQPSRGLTAGYQLSSCCCSFAGPRPNPICLRSPLYRPHPQLVKVGKFHWGDCSSVTIAEVLRLVSAAAGGVAPLFTLPALAHSRAHPSSLACFVSVTHLLNGSVGQWVGP